MFRLAAGAVACDRNEAKVGEVALLERMVSIGTSKRWRVRHTEVLNRELGLHTDACSMEVTNDLDFDEQRTVGL